MESTKTVMILGGGVGGVVAAQELRKRLPRPHRVVLVEREDAHVFAPSLLWLMVGQRRPQALQRPIAALGRRGIEVLRGDVEHIHPESKSVTVSGAVHQADYLVVALGAELDSASIPGLSEAGHDFYTLAGAESFYAALQGFARGRVVVMTAAPAYKCPAAPYEAALLIDAFLRERGRRDAARVEVCAAEPGPMGVAGPEVSAGVKGLLAGRAIAYHPEHQIESVDPATKTLAFSNGARVGFDLLAYVPPHRAPRVVRESSLGGASGWIEVDREQLETRYPGVFAVGDVTTIPLSLGKPLPKAGVFAHGQAMVVARNIATRIQGRTPSERFAGRGQCFIEIGEGRAGFGGGDFYAEPRPEVRLHAPSWAWHAGKVLFEQSWLRMRF